MCLRLAWLVATKGLGEESQKRFSAWLKKEDREGQLTGWRSAIFGIREAEKVLNRLVISVAQSVQAPRKAR